MSTTGIFLGIEKAYEKTWHFGLLYALSELKFSISLIKLISSFLSQRNFRLGRRLNAYAKGHTSKGATRFHPVLHIVQYV
jgi:hypothetical protein